MEYIETFDDGPGGWFGWISNAAGMKPLEIRDSSAISRSPWWIDYNHAPPGAGYLHLLYMLNTGGKAGEHQREVHGENRFIQGRLFHGLHQCAGHPAAEGRARVERGTTRPPGPGRAGRHLFGLAVNWTAVSRHPRLE